MALTFGGATSDRVDIAGSASLNDLSTFTLLAWVYPTTLTGARQVCSFRRDASGTSGMQFRIAGTTTEMTLRVNQATTSANYATNSGAIALNTWCYLAATYDNNGGSPLIKIYHGRLSSLVVEGTYGTTTAGSGARTAEAGGTHMWGNRVITTTNFDSAWPGRIAFGQFYNRVLSLGELSLLQYSPTVLSGCVNYIHLGFNGTGTQPDWSGNGNSGTITGATLTPDHVPLRAPFAFSRGWKGAFTAAATNPFLQRLILSQSVKRASHY